MDEPERKPVLRFTVPPKEKKTKLGSSTYEADGVNSGLPKVLVKIALLSRARVTGPRKRITSAPIFSNREPPPQRFRLRRYGLGGRSRFNRFKKFARRANFLKWCRGEVWGRSPSRNLRYPCLAPGGGLGGFAPQESPLPVPCPRSSTYGR